MRVCAVIDDAETAWESLQDESLQEGGRDPEACAARAILRSGRPPRSPSACLRLRRDGVPVATGRARTSRNHKVHKRTPEIHHVGNAMVVFSPASVAPFFQVDWRSAQTPSFTR